MSSPPGSEHPSDPTPKRQTRLPWHLRLFFGSAAEIPDSAIRLLRLVALGMFFENFDVGLLNAALPQIADSLAIASEDTGFILGAIRMGGIGTFLLLPFADRLGRRKLFLAALLGMSIGVACTALSQTALQFVAAQFFARVFMMLAAALAVVILLEDFPAQHRGAGLGLLGLLAGLGYGLAMILYGFVEVIPGGWRTLYWVGVVPGLLLPFFRRALRETSRFRSHSQSRPSLGGWFAEWLRPIRGLVGITRRRAIAVGIAGLCSSSGSIALHQYTSLFLQQVHGWPPSAVPLLLVVGGPIALLGNILGGRISDRFGRKRVGVVGLALVPVGTTLFFQGPEAALAATWGLAVLAGSMGDLVLRALAVELFPTAQRGTSSGWLILVQTLGWSTGLVLISLLGQRGIPLHTALTVVPCLTLLGAAALLGLPDTHGRSLEAIDHPGEEA